MVLMNLTWPEMPDDAAISSEAAPTSDGITAMAA